MATVCLRGSLAQSSWIQSMDDKNIDGLGAELEKRTYMEP